MTQPVTRDAIREAAVRIQGHVRVTPTVSVRPADLGLDGDFELSLKLEMLQHTGSFKPRGAFNRALSASVPEAGVIAASGGNHAQAVAYLARQLKFRAEIFVPETVPAIKLRRLQELGAEIFQVGEVYDDAREASEARAMDTGALVIHAYDQPEIVAGAGTLAMELMEQEPGLDTVLVAVGGGGLIGGTAAWLRGDRRVWSVEPERCPGMKRALDAGHPVQVGVSGYASDSLGARRIGAIAFSLAREWVTGALLVSDEHIAAAQRVLWDRLRVIAEPGGATSVAALLSGCYRPETGEHVVALVCGANTDPAKVAAP